MSDGIEELWKGLGFAAGMLGVAVYVWVLSRSGGGE